MSVYTQCDKFFQFEKNDFVNDKKYTIIEKEKNIELKYELYVRKNKEEYQYINLVKDVIENGNERIDRTNVGTYSKFGVQMRFSLKGGSMPLLTTKRVWFRGVAEELLWFINGCTDSKYLAKRGVKIWDENGKRENLDKLGFKTREEGDLGPVYGFQWRHFGAPYADCKTDYKGKGVDQLQICIDMIKNNPFSRRILLSSWNPSQIPQMALPPCHVLCQFYVHQKNLSCQMYQRSADLGLGAPFNIASYSLLTILIAHICDLNPSEFVYVIGDAHVYKNHVEPLKKQLERTPRSFPKLILKRKVSDISDFKYEDFELVNYQPMSKIKMKMAV